MSKRDRDRRPARRQPFKDPKPRILVVCEGRFSEPEYLNGLIIACANPRVSVEIKPGSGVPKTIVEFAKELKLQNRQEAKRGNDENILYESIWCVFDIDDHPNVPGSKRMAKDNGLEVAISSPAFELWLLLHFRGFPGQQHRDKITRMLKKFVPSYDKHVEFRSDYQATYSAAVDRALKMDQDAIEADEENRNPTTGFYRLTELIRGDEKF